MGSNGVSCAKCAKYLAFDTYGISDINALIKVALVRDFY